MTTNITYKNHIFIRDPTEYNSLILEFVMVNPIFFIELPERGRIVRDQADERREIISKLLCRHIFPMRNDNNGAFSYKMTHCYSDKYSNNGEIKNYFALSNVSIK